MAATKKSVAVPTKPPAEWETWSAAQMREVLFALDRAQRSALTRAYQIGGWWKRRRDEYLNNQADDHRSWEEVVREESGGRTPGTIGYYRRIYLRWDVVIKADAHSIHEALQAISAADGTQGRRATTSPQPYYVLTPAGRQTLAGFARTAGIAAEPERLAHLAGLILARCDVSVMRLRRLNRPKAQNA